MADLNPSVRDTVGAYVNPPDQRRAAALQVCGRATDVDDAAHLLDVLDLLDTSLSTGNPQRHPQPAPVSVWPLRAGRPPRTGGRR